MLSLFSITIFGLSIPPASREGRHKNGREAAEGIWQAILDLDQALPHGARMFTFQDKNGKEYESNKKRIREYSPIPKPQEEAFRQQATIFWKEAERQKPYLSTKLNKLIMDYERFLNDTLMVAQHGDFMSDLSFPWEKKGTPPGLSNFKQKRKYRRCSSGQECLIILNDAISDEVSKVCR